MANSAPETSGTSASAARAPSRTDVATSRLVAACATVGPAATRCAYSRAASAKPSSGSTRLTTFHRSRTAAG